MSGMSRLTCTYFQLKLKWRKIPPEKPRLKQQPNRADALMAAK
jgi:hypothetical protein